MIKGTKEIVAWRRNKRGGVFPIFADEGRGKFKENTNKAHNKAYVKSKKWSKGTVKNLSADDKLTLRVAAANIRYLINYPTNGVFTKSKIKERIKSVKASKKLKEEYIKKEQIRVLKNAPPLRWAIPRSGVLKVNYKKYYKKWY